MEIMHALHHGVGILSATTTSHSAAAQSLGTVGVVVAPSAKNFDFVGGPTR